MKWYKNRIFDVECIVNKLFILFLMKWYKNRIFDVECIVKCDVKIDKVTF